MGEVYKFIHDVTLSKRFCVMVGSPGSCSVGSP
jgi:hypothetical protein